MTARARQQLLWLAVLVVVLGGALWFNRAGAPAGGEAIASNPVRSGAAPAAEGTTGVADVQLELLHAPREELAPAQRNPFRFQARVQPAQSRAPQPPPVVEGPVLPTGPPPPPTIPLKFIGIFDAPTRVGRLAILSDSRGNVFYGKEGDTIDGRYQVLKIGTESADLAYSDGRGRQTIRLSGQ